MWRISAHQVAYEPHGKDIEVPVMSPDWSLFLGDVHCVIPSVGPYKGYDDWCSQFSREDEISLVQRAITDVKKHKGRIHIRGISLSESVSLLREYYRDCGYEDVLAKNYTIPSSELLTVSISLRHVLWCEKDKDFLNRHDASQKSYGCTTPPLRSPADLRVLQQALRMGIIMGIEVSSDEEFLYEILQKQILSPFHIGQMTAFRWEEHGFSGHTYQSVLRIPLFSSEEGEDF